MTDACLHQIAAIADLVHQLVILNALGAALFTAIAVCLALMKR